MPPEAILVLGITGSGKSTLTKYLSHQDSDLRAEEEDAKILIRGDLIGSSVMSVTKVAATVLEASPPRSQVTMTFLGMDCSYFECTTF